MLYSSHENMLLTYLEQLVHNHKATRFSNNTKAIKEIKGFMKSQETIYVYCESLETDTGKINLKFNI